ncbi:MAG: hypothetical protein LBD14_06385 [Puniceicoccales bacterium]|nr:hypothetical protein [Puniceicoccales bacterium]
MRPHPCPATATLALAAAMIAMPPDATAQSHSWDTHSSSRRIQFHPSPPGEPSMPIEQMPGYPLNPVIGKILWVDATGTHATALLTQHPAPKKDARLGTRDATLRPSSQPRLVQHKAGSRIAGLRIERGTAHPGQELVRPGARMMEELEKLPARGNPNPEPPASPSTPPEKTRAPLPVKTPQPEPPSPRPAAVKEPRPIPPHP